MLTDAELVDRVIAGFDDAFDELYRRHSNAAWRLGQAVTGNAHDAADAVSEAFARVLKAVRDGRLEHGAAFRPYLLTATRNAALDGLRRQGKARPTDDEHLDLTSLDPSPVESLTGAEDAALVAEAFRNLPERWRSVLWLTEVEGIATKDAADQLGLTANGTAQLAVRARAGLRDRYLQAHVRNHARPSCRFTVDHLGAYVGGGLSPRDLAKVDQHLAGCADCRERKAELDDLGHSLRRIVLPVPLALGALSARKVHAVLTATSAAAPSGFAAKAVQLAKEPTPFMRKAVGASAAGVLALGVLSLGMVNDGPAGVTGLAGPKTAAPASASVEVPAATFDSPAATSVLGGSATYDFPSVSRRGFTSPGSGAAPAAKPAAKPAPAKANPPAATRPEQNQGLLPAPVCGLLPVCGTAPTPAPLPSVAVGANLLDQKVGVAVDLAGDTPAVGVTVPVVGTVGEPAPTPPAEQGVTVNLGGNPVVSLP